MLTSLVYLPQGMSKNPKKMAKIVEIDKEKLHILRSTSEILMNFAETMCLTIILKVTKNQGCTLSLENTVLEKPQGRIRLTSTQPF